MVQRSRRLGLVSVRAVCCVLSVRWLELFLITVVDVKNVVACRLGATPSFNALFACDLRVDLSAELAFFLLDVVRISVLTTLFSSSSLSRISVLTTLFSSSSLRCSHTLSNPRAAWRRSVACRIFLLLARKCRLPHCSLPLSKRTWRFAVPSCSPSSISSLRIKDVCFFLQYAGPVDTHMDKRRPVADMKFALPVYWGGGGGGGIINTLAWPQKLN